MTTPYIVHFIQLVCCLILDNIVPKVTPHSCNYAMLTCPISDSIVFKLPRLFCQSRNGWTLYRIGDLN